MKINTKSKKCHWRDNDLPPLMERIPLPPEADFQVLFANSLCLDSNLQESLLAKLLSTNSDDPIYFYYPAAEMIDSLCGYTSISVLDYAINEGFAESVYIFDSSCRFLIYSNSRDSVSIWLVPMNLINSKEIRAWDDGFLQQLEITGIGFGDDGKAYLRQLLSDLADREVRSRARVLKIAKMAENIWHTTSE